MRYILIAALCLSSAVNSQTRSDSLQLIKNTVKLYDLEFTDAEADSMIGNLNNYYQLYKGMHKTLPANDIPYPFAFHPAPAGMKVPGKPEKISWDIPVKVELPANRNDLSFYSIPQLASLFRYTKKSSV